MKRIFVICFIIFILIISFFIFMFMFYGTPWGKVKALKQVQEYLDKTYRQNMVAKSVTYDVDGNTYMVMASPKSNENIKFFVYIDKNGEVWKDKYYIEYFSYELGKGANQYIKELFGNVNRAYAAIDGESIKSYNIEKLSENTKLDDVINKFNGKYYFGVVIYREFPILDYKEDAQKMLKFINYAKSLKSKPNKILFSYYKDGDTSSKSLFFVRFDQKEYASITKIEDLISYIQEIVDRNKK